MGSQVYLHTPPRAAIACGSAAFDTFGLDGVHCLSIQLLATDHRVETAMLGTAIYSERH